jgi:endonuclease-3 related protein
VTEAFKLAMLVSVNTWSDLPGDPGLARSAQLSPRGPFVGTPPPRRAPRRWAEHDGLDELLRELQRGFGFQRWWPAETPFEVIAGAILTQNTAWTNVEKALANLRTLAPITPANLLAMRAEVLCAALKPSGYFNAKAKKLEAISRWYLEYGGLAALREQPLERVREDLLNVWGVGPETADSILCYAAQRPSVVIDAYTRRILSRHGWIDVDAPYETVRTWLAERLRPTQWILEEFHALFVRAGYGNCKPTARCESCPATTPARLGASGPAPKSARRAR